MLVEMGGVRKQRPQGGHVLSAELPITRETVLAERYRDIPATRREHLLVTAFAARVGFDRRARLR